MMRNARKVLLFGMAIAALGMLSAKAADTEKSDVKNGIEGKIAKVDAEKGSVTISDENNRERTFSVTDETVIVGPRGGIVHKRLKDRRFHPGLSITIVANGTRAAQLHLGYDRKARGGSATSSEPASTSSSSSTSKSGTATSGTSSSTTRTARFRGLPDSNPAAGKDSAKSEDAEDEDTEFPGKVKSVDAAKRMLVITLLTGKDRSFLLSNDVKITVRGRASRRGLSDMAIKPGVPLTVITESGGKKVKEVKVTPVGSRRAKRAA